MTWSNLPLWAYPASAIFATLAVVSVILFRPREKPTRPHLEMAPSLDGVDTLNTAAVRILEQVAGWIQGKAYHAYWLDGSGTLLQLRASLAPGGNPPVVPDYSGLIVEETPIVPLTRKPPDGNSGAFISGTDSEPWLEIPFGRHLLVRVLLTGKQDVRESSIKRLTDAAQAYSPLAVAIYEWFKAREALEQTQATAKISARAREAALHPARTVELLLQVAARLIDCPESCAVIAGLSEPLILSESAAGRELGLSILNNEIPELITLSAQPDVVSGSALGRFGHSCAACVRIPLTKDGQVLGCFFGLTKNNPSINEYQMTVLRTLGERAAGLVAAELEQESFSQSYTSTLRLLVSAVDSLDIHTVGSSDRLARYARLCARELGLPAGEAEAIAKGAFFHDVGNVAVSQRLLAKQGRYSPVDYSEMKIHPEIGALLVEPLQSSLPLGPMVAAHHERWDGHGYPQGLTGEEIPLGARIISTADLFEAKTSARSYRSPLPFQRALEDIKSAAGTQLDPRVVTAFLTAIEKERRRAKPGLPPLPCWKMKQLPSDVCEGCPNRIQAVSRCWEYRDHRCRRHGDQCETCAVHTEVISRR